MKKILFISTFFCLIANVQIYGQRVETIHLTEAGTLSKIVTNPVEVTHLTLTGTIDARDIYFLDALFYLESLDLSDANIVEFEGISKPSNPYDQSRFYPANQLPTFAFSLSRLSSLIFPKTLTSIDFYGINQDMMPLPILVIPEGVTTIGDRFASYQPLLKALTLPSTLMTLGDRSFISSENLSVIINFNPTPINIDNSVFERVNKNACILYVPIKSKSDYEVANVWKEFNIIELPEIAKDDITITPSDTTALIEWKSYENAEGYKLIIYGNETHTDTILILEFDTKGKLLRSENTTLFHTIKNLSTSTDYHYTFEILGVSNVVLANQSGEFSTTGEPTNIIRTVSASNKIEGYYSIWGTKLLEEPKSGMYIILYSNGQTEKRIKINY